MGKSEEEILSSIEEARKGRWEALIAGTAWIVWWDHRIYKVPALKLIRGSRSYRIKVGSYYSVLETKVSLLARGDIFLTKKEAKESLIKYLEKEISAYKDQLATFRRKLNNVKQVKT